MVCIFSTKSTTVQIGSWLTPPPSPSVSSLSVLFNPLKIISLTSLLSGLLLQSPPAAQVLLCSLQVRTLDFTADPLFFGLSPTFLTSSALGSPQLC